MKTPRFSRLFSASCIIGLSSPAWAVDIFKADNTNDLATPGSWTTVAPTSADRAVWNNTVLSANTSNLGTTAAWLGIKIGDGSGNPGGNVGLGINSGRTLTLGSNGIDLSQATVDLTISGAGNLRTASGASQTFNVATGRKLNIDTTMSTAGGTTTVTVNGGGSVNFSKALSNATSPLNIITNGATSTFTGGTSNLTSLSAGALGSAVINGATINSNTLSSFTGSVASGAKFELSSGAVNFNAGVRTGSADGDLIMVSGGTFTATDIQLQRTSNPGQVSNVTSTSGFVATGGTASINTFRVGTSNSSATARIDGSAVTINDNINIGNTTNTRWSSVQVASGSLTVSGATGIQLSTNTATANNSQLLLTGGTTTTEAIKFGSATSFAGSRGDVIVNNGATLYVGTGGVMVVSANTYTANFSVTGATLGAKADWSTSVPIALSGNATIKAADAADASFNVGLNGQLSGTGANLIKTGGGTLTLGTSNSYTGTTTISEGSLALGAAASITSPGIINNGNFNVSAVVGYSLGAGQSISGSGTVTGDMIVAGTLSPGNSPGTLSTGNLVWATGGDYNWQVLDAAGAAGGGYDTISITGTLDLSGLASGGFNVNLWSLSSTGPDVDGNANNFNNASAYSWTLATTTAGITGFDAADFSISTVANNGTAGFSNELAGGAFSLAQSGNNLVLNFAPVPEPAAALLGSLGLLALMRRRRN